MCVMLRLAASTSNCSLMKRGVVGKFICTRSRSLDRRSALWGLGSASAMAFTRVEAFFTGADSSDFKASFCSASSGASTACKLKES